MGETFLHRVPWMDSRPRTIAVGHKDGSTARFIWASDWRERELRNVLDRGLSLHVRTHQGALVIVRRRSHGR